MVKMKKKEIGHREAMFDKIFYEQLWSKRFYTIKYWLLCGSLEFDLLCMMLSTVPKLTISLPFVIVQTS